MVVTYTLKPGKDIRELEKLLTDFYYATIEGERDIYYFGFGRE